MSLKMTGRLAHDPKDSETISASHCPAALQGGFCFGLKELVEEESSCHANIL